MREKSKLIVGKTLSRSHFTESLFTAVFRPLLFLIAAGFLSIILASYSVQAQSNTDAVEALKKLAFELRDGDSVKIYMRIGERSGKEVSMLEVLGSYGITSVKHKNSKLKQYVVKLQISDMRHSTITLAPDEQRFIVNTFSEIEILLDNELRGTKILNWQGFRIDMPSLRAA